VDATRVQSSRFQRVWGGSLKAELLTGRTPSRTAISVWVQASADRLRAADYQAHARARWAKAANRAGAAEAQAATGLGRWDRPGWSAAMQDQRAVVTVRRAAAVLCLDYDSRGSPLF